MLPDPPLLLVTDRRQAARPLAEVAGAAFAAGCRWLSVREKDLPGPELLDLARALAALGRERGARVTVHGPAGLALAAGADGAHLPAGADAAEARAALGPRALLGQSVHGRAEAEAAARAGVDYVVLGPVFPTASKPGYGPALGPEGLAAVARGLGVPVVGIGGVGPAEIPACLAAGAAGVAAMGTVMRAADPEASVRDLLAALGMADARGSERTGR